MIPNHAITILLATYNGAAYLPEFLASLQRQKHTNWRLLVRDDSSSDDTRAILGHFAQQESRMDLVDDRQGRLGTLGNFQALMERALAQGAHVVCFADQDDVWLPEKLAAQLAKLEQAQDQAPDGTPVLVHSDMSVVDRHLKPIHRSFMAYQGIRHQAAPLVALLAQNFVTGCTMMFNRALLQLACPLPPGAIIHDWWLALCAAAWGRVVYLDQPTLLYRQHGGNQVGAKSLPALLNPLRGKLYAHLGRAHGHFIATFRQAHALAEKIRHAGNTQATSLLPRIEAYSRLHEQGRAHRLATVRRHEFRRQGRTRNLMFRLMLLLAPRG